MSKKRYWGSRWICLAGQSLSSPAVRCDGTALGSKVLLSKDLLRYFEGHSLFPALSESNQGFINEVSVLLLEMYVCMYICVCLSIYFSLPLVWRDGLGICWVNVVFSFASMGTEALKACSWRPLTSRSKWSRVSCFLDQCRLILAFLRLGCPLELGRRVHVMKALKSVPAGA